ncbi:MAG: hypothetical protein CVT48_02350 [Thermoplasmata archaeon HGW-Thermoplasmata-1]|nr:MAG: hypothetical protein CVT48_02350 [Thermoplasmata archaeon HGW-Thermoplasmata-1]
MLHAVRSFEYGVFLSIAVGLLFILPHCIATDGYVKDDSDFGDTWISPGHFTAKNDAEITFKVKIIVSVECDPEVHEIYLLIFNKSGIMTNKTMFQGEIGFGEEKEVSTTYMITGFETQYKFGFDWTESVHYPEQSKKHWDETDFYSISIPSDTQSESIPSMGAVGAMIALFAIFFICRLQDKDS